jgi:hypothetical protein
MEYVYAMFSTEYNAICNAKAPTLSSNIQTGSLNNSPRKLLKFREFTAVLDQNNSLPRHVLSRCRGISTRFSLGKFTSLLEGIEQRRIAYSLKHGKARRQAR